MLDAPERVTETITGQQHHLVSPPQAPNTLVPVTSASLQPTYCEIHVGSMSAPDMAVFTPWLQETLRRWGSDFYSERQNWQEDIAQSKKTIERSLVPKAIPL